MNKSRDVKIGTLMFETLMAVTIKNVIPWSLVRIYPHFRGNHYFHLQASKFLEDYKEWHLRRRTPYGNLQLRIVGLQGREIRVFPTTSTPDPRPIQPPNQWVPAALSRRLSDWSLRLTTFLYLVPRLRVGGTPPICSDDVHRKTFHRRFQLRWQTRNFIPIF